MIQIRRAHENEAECLTDLAARSKAHWPYDEEYLRRCRQVTIITPDDIRSWPFLVAVLEGRIQGFAGICNVKGRHMLDHLWIEPASIGRGLGRILFEESVQHAKSLGWNQFTIAADPYAEAVYLKMGAVRIGEIESKVKKGFYLPLMTYTFR